MGGSGLQAAPEDGGAVEAVVGEPRARRFGFVCSYLGLGRPLVRREELPGRAPRALSLEDQRRVLRSAERVSARDRAIVVAALYTGLRLAELVALDLEMSGSRRARGW